MYLCKCNGEISRHVDLDEVTKRIAILPNVRAVVCHDALCSEGGRVFVREVINANPSNRVVIGACSAEVLDVPLAVEFEAAGANKYLVEQIDIREQCAWVHPDIKSATAKATALVRGGIHRSLKQEPLEDLIFPVEGAALIVGAGEAGSIAAKTIAASGFKVYVIDKSGKVSGDEGQIDARSANSNCRGCKKLDSTECPIPPTSDDLKSDGRIQLHLDSEIEDIEGGVGRWRIRTRTPDGMQEFDVGTVIITTPPVHRISETSAESTPPPQGEGAPGREPSEEAKRIMDMIHVGRGEGRTVRHLVGRHLPELNRGILILESSLGQDNAICAVEDSGLAADALIDLMRKRTAKIPRIIARVEEFRCRGCGKCKEVCEYDAVTLEEREGGVKVAKIDEARCEGCGLCRVACCNGAMALLGYTTTQLLANMMGIIEEVEP